MNTETGTVRKTDDTSISDTGTVGNSGSGSKTYNNLTDTETRNLSNVIDRDDSETTSGTTSDSATDDTTRELRRRGNIGVTTSQQMLESEINLWGNYNFINKVIQDTLKVISLQIWEGER